MSDPPLYPVSYMSFNVLITGQNNLFWNDTVDFLLFQEKVYVTAFFFVKNAYVMYSLTVSMAKMKRIVVSIQSIIIFF